MLPLQLQPETHIPLYIQLRDQLRALVDSGELRPGDRIPASRELASQLGVHRTTVANAYAELESEGLIQGHVGRGTFICAPERPVKLIPAPAKAGNGFKNGNGSIRWEALFADERGEESLNRLLPEVSDDCISFAVAKPPDDFFPLEEFRQSCNAALRDAGEQILQLGSSDGYPPLKSALVEWLRSEGLAVREGQLLITDGCQQALDLLYKLFLRPGDTVVMENPTYPGAIALLANSRVRCLGVPVRTGPGPAGGVDVGALEAVLMQNRVKLILLSPDFQNPTGTTLPASDRRQLLELVARHQVPIVEDHIYAGLKLRGSTVPSLKQLDRAGLVIQIDSFSKVAFPGLRVGWCVAPENVIDRLRLIKQAVDLHTGQLSQAALAEFLRRGCLTRHVTKMRAVYRGRLEAMEEALRKHMPEGVEWTRPDGGMAIWVSLPAGFDASELLIRIRERGVMFTPGRFFYFQHPEPNTLRLAFSALDKKKIARGVAALGEALRIEMRRRHRGAWQESSASVALV